MTLQVKADAFLELVDEGAELEQLGTGFTFTEGPLWNPEGFLLFSDMPGDVRRRWDEQGAVREVANPSNKGNGMTFDLDGRLIVCEHVTSSVVRMDPDGTGSGREVLATHFEGRELNSPNDVVVKSDGAIYFTDPTYGRMPGFGIEREQDLSFQGVYRLPPGGGDPQLLDDDFGQPNGLCFTADERVLYVNDTERTNIRAFDVRDDGTLGPGRVVADGHRLRRPGRRRPRRRHEARRARQHLGHRPGQAPGSFGCASSAPRASTWAPSRCPRPWATSTGAVPTGAGCSSPRRRRCSACSARSRATASRT